MKITRIALTHHRLALDPPFHAAWDGRPRRALEASILRIETDQGLTGIGSGDAMPGFAGHEDLFLGHDPRELDRHFQIIDNLSFHYGRCWPLDIALWDLFGKITGQPVWRLLGGAGGRLRVYASAGRARTPEELADAALRYLGEGFRALKVRFANPDWRRDVAGIAAIRRAVGADLTLMVDANQAWRMGTPARRGGSRTRWRSPARSRSTTSTGWRSRCTAAISKAWRRCATPRACASPAARWRARSTICA